MEGDFSKLIIGLLLFVAAATAWTTFWGGAFDSYSESPDTFDEDTFNYTSDITETTDDMRSAMSPKTDPSFWDFGALMATGAWGAVKLSFSSINILWDAIGTMFLEGGFGSLGLGYIAPILMAIIAVMVIMAVISVVMKRKL